MMGIRTHVAWGAPPYLASTARGHWYTPLRGPIILHSHHFNLPLFDKMSVQHSVYLHCRRCEVFHIIQHTTCTGMGADCEKLSVF